MVVRVPFAEVFSPVDRSSSIPLNTQIVFQFDEAVRRGRIKRGDLLPSENELCTGFEVARSTLRRALAQIESTGGVSRERGRGKGTRVESVPPISRTPGSFDTVYEMIAASARKPITRLLAFEPVIVDQGFSEESGFPEGTRLVHILRHRSANELPIAVLENWILQSHVPFESQRLERESMEVLLRESGVRIQHADFEFRPALAGATAEFFGIDEATPVINEVRHSFDASGQYEYSFHHSHPQNERVRGRSTPP